MTDTEIFYFFFPAGVCSRERRGPVDVLENLHVKHKAEATKAKNEPASAVAKTSAVQLDLGLGDRSERKI